MILSTGDASVIKDFYSLELNDGRLTDVFETLMSEIEGPASGALRKVVGGEWPISGETRVDLASWISLQVLRGEEPRASQTQMKAELVRIIVGSSGKEALRRHIEACEQRVVSDKELHEE